MSLTNDNQLEVQVDGVANWGAGLNANFQILERGFHLTGLAGAAVVSGQVLMAQSGYVYPYDSRSLSLGYPVGMALTSVSSGASLMYLFEGVVRSMTIWSGNITPGQPVYVHPTSPGFCVDSFIAAAYPIGLALDNNAILVSPGRFNPLPEITTQVVSKNDLATGVTWDFAMQLAHRGIVRKLRVKTNSHDAYKVQLHSNSTRASSELLYNTLTTSVNGGNQDFDIKSLDFIDQAGFPVYSTNTSSPGLLYFRIQPQSIATVSSAEMWVELTVERFR